MQDREAHCNSVDELVALFETSLDRGLATQVAQDRLLELGANELVKEERASPIALFFAQFKNTLIVILLAATVLSAALGEIVDAAIIAAIVLFCAVLSFVQEYRADNALNALKKMLAPMVRVLRDGIETRIPSRELVPGDVMLLEAGDRIAADARLAEIHSLKCDEAPLTGESFPVEKSLTPPPSGAALGDRRNVVFAGTTVTYGRGKAIVTSHGMATEFGRIAEQVADVAAEPSPLERRTAEVGRWLGLIALVVCAVTIVVSVVRAWMGNELDVELVLTMTMFAIALAVAAVPEALAAIVTGALAVGMHEMAKRNALVRRMPAVETLGCTTVICSDKTGTLTKGEMTARRLFVGGRSIEIGGAGYDPVGSFDPPLRPGDSAAQLMLAGGLLCSDATLGNDSGRWFVKGDPTEGALIVLAAKAGLEPSGTRTSAPRVAEFPFSSERKRMTTVHRMPDGRHLAFVKGAPEVLLERTDRPGRQRYRAELLRHLRRLGHPAEPFPGCPESEAAGLRGDWRAAAAAWERAGRPYERALELAESGQPEPTLEALAVLTQLGALPAVAIVRERLRLQGVRQRPRAPQRATLANSSRLTARQVEILRLVADGLSNAEIAHRLVLSTRTVDHHVSAVLQKLGLASRRDAAGALAALEPLP